MKFKWEYMLMNKFQEIIQSGIVPFAYVGKDEIHMCMQYEVSTTVYKGKAANQRKVPKLLSFKKTVSQND